MVSFGGKKKKKNLTLTSGLGEPGQDRGGKIVVFLERVPAGPLVLDRHLENAPSRENERDTLAKEV